ncbi:uncharacterized protein LOC131855646 [Achroia grisella]|uniref:uncharacterized protein LOC131855646 n=1 Tax=Achroia grisella TaxID=688607 RepID=UPI0027D32435|nr:uncharacterized protein LOC131855646 [Achroia grisella]
MEKSSSNSDAENNKDEDPTTSKQRGINPLLVSHNMNDLKTLDFNSADEVRQTMKAVLASKLSSADTEELIQTKPSNNIKQEITTSAINGSKTSFPKLDPKIKNNVIQMKNKSNWSSTNKMNRKRPGRPPKAGPSKKLKKSSVTALYIGKLSNVVAYKHRWREADSEYDSDVDSVMILY